MQTSQEYLTTIVYAKFGAQTECVMDNWKIVNAAREKMNLFSDTVHSSRTRNSMKKSVLHVRHELTNKSVPSSPKQELKITIFDDNLNI